MPCYNYFICILLNSFEQISGTNENIYGGFWLRLGAMMMDGVLPDLKREKA